ncbi:hypothetical protein J7J23_00565 [bacterium]|nr:hypothetical protein [bacterium]
MTAIDIIIGIVVVLSGLVVRLFPRNLFSWIEAIIVVLISFFVFYFQNGFNDIVFIFGGFFIVGIVLPDIWFSLRRAILRPKTILIVIFGVVAIYLYFHPLDFQRIVSVLEPVLVIIIVIFGFYIMIRPLIKK